MLSFFRTNQIYASLLLFLYALTLQLPLILLPAAPPPVTEPVGILGKMLLDYFSGPGWLNLLAAAMLTGTQAVLANVIADRYRLSRIPSQFPGFFLISCWAVVPDFHWLNPGQLGNVFLLFSLMSIGRIYKHNEPAVALFNAGAWLALAALAAPSFLLFGFAVVAGVGILRTPSPTNLLRVASGTFIIFFLVGTFFYFRGSFPQFTEAQFGGLELVQFTAADRADLIGLGVLGFLIFLNLLSHGPATQLLNIEGKKNVNILFWVLLVAPLTLVFGGSAGAAGGQAVVVPLGVLLGLQMLRQSNRRAEFYHFLLVVGAVLLMVYRWWLPAG